MSKRMRVFVMGLAIVALIAAVGIAVAEGPRNYRAHLSGPEGIATLGQGEAIFQFSTDGQTLSYRLIVANIEDVTMAHIHVAAMPGQSGPPALWLYPPQPPAQPIPGRSQGPLGVGTATAANLVGPIMSGKTLADLRQAIEEGRAYVNVHTLAYPAGEINGVIR